MVKAIKPNSCSARSPFNSVPWIEETDSIQHILYRQ
jgi:hypothetical protein